MREIRLPLPPYAYSFNLLLEFVKRIAYPARLVVDGDRLWRFIDGHLLSISQSGDAIVIRGDSLACGDVQRIERICRQCLGLCHDLSAFYQYAAEDEALWSVVAPLQGLPIFCTESVFEALITLIIEQHITWKNALRYQRTLMRMFHEGVAVGRAKVFDFPSPAQLAAVAPADLKPLKITNRRINTLIEIAKSVDECELDLEAISQLKAQAAYDYLLNLYGVGHWTANNVVGRALGAYPFVSQNDVALQAAVLHYFCGGVGAKSAALVTETLGRFGAYAGLAGHFALLRWVLDRYPSGSC
jgi:3-methyladenine DNA glycosylase/8-oxoguanine DNA glycosylase